MFMLVRLYIGNNKKTSLNKAFLMALLFKKKDIKYRLTPIE